MADGVKTRRYDSPRRREQAAATRRAILEAAERLVVRQGYAATTMASIAAEARVALKTVYIAFETKSGVLRALWNLRLRGDEGDAPVAERQWYLDVIEEPDPERKLRLTAANSRTVKQRIAPLMKVIGEAAPTDPDIAVLWKRIETQFHENQRAIVHSMDSREALKPGLSADRAADILWTINHPAVWRLLVEERGWTPDDYERWCGDLACEQLLAERPPETTKAPPSGASS
jgi:AcrR family transcriptional regulator